MDYNELYVILKKQVTGKRLHVCNTGEQRHRIGRSIIRPVREKAGSRGTTRYYK